MNKIKNLLQITILFYQQHLGHILFLIILSGLFILFRFLPYINIIPYYFDYVIAIIIVIIILLFKKQLPSKKMFIITEIFVALAFLLELLWINNATKFLGFILFVLLFFTTFLQVLIHRDKLKKF